MQAIAKMCLVLASQRRLEMRTYILTQQQWKSGHQCAELEHKGCMHAAVNPPILSNESAATILEIADLSGCWKHHSSCIISMSSISQPDWQSCQISWQLLESVIQVHRLSTQETATTCLWSNNQQFCLYPFMHILAQEHTENAFVVYLVCRFDLGSLKCMNRQIAVQQQSKCLHCGMG